GGDRREGRRGSGPVRWGLPHQRGDGGLPLQARPLALPQPEACSGVSLLPPPRRDAGAFFTTRPSARSLLRALIGSAGGQGLRPPSSHLPSVAGRRGPEGGAERR